jgi:hypothetical protein
MVSLKQNANKSKYALATKKGGQFMMRKNGMN